MGYGFGRINDLADEALTIARAHGFQVKPIDMNSTEAILALLCLVHSEVSEACEEVRVGDRKKFETELADIVIRVLSLSAALNINIEQAIVNKMEKNRAREVRHGGKRA